MSTQDIRKTEGTDIADTIKAAAEGALKANANDNKETASEEAKDTLETAALLSETAPTNKRDISYQILSEPLTELAGEESSINNFIEFLRVQSGAFIQDRLEKLGILSEVSADPTKVVDDETEKAINESGSNMTDVAFNIANDNASGNIFLNSKSNARFSAVNGIRLDSNNMVGMDAPLVANHAGNYHLQVNNTSTHLAKASFSNINTVYHEGSQLTNQLKNNLLVATEADEAVSQFSSRVGTKAIQMAGGQALVAAETELTSISNGSNTEATRLDKTAISGNYRVFVNTTSSETSETGDIAGGGDPNPDATPVLNQGEIVFISQNAAGVNSIFQIDNKGNNANVFPGNIVNASEGMTITRSSKGNLIVDSIGVAVGTPKKQVIFGGGRVSIGGLAVNFPSIKAPRLKDLPEFPRLPKIPTETLESCIPEKFKGLNVSINNPPLEIPDVDGRRDSEGVRLPTDTEEEEDSRRRGPRGPRLPGQDEDEDDAIQIDPPSKENATTNPNAKAVEKDEKLNSEPIDKGEETDSISTHKRGTAATDVYLPETTQDALAKSILLGSSAAAGIDGIDFDITQIDLDKETLLSEGEVLSTLVDELDLPTERVTELISPLNKIIKEAYSVINEDGVNILKELINSDEPSVDQLPEALTVEERQLIVDFIKEFPQSRKFIYDSIVLTQASVGFLGAIGGIVGSVIPNVGGLLSGGIGLDVLGSSLFDFALDLGKNFLISQLSNWLGNTPFSFLIGAANGLLSGQGFDFNAILNGVIDTGIKSLLPPSLSSIAGPLSQIIGGVIEGGNVDLRDIDFRGTVEGILREATPLGDVIDIVNDVEEFTNQLLIDYESGDLNTLLTGPGIRGLLTTILGQNSSGQLNTVFSTIEDVLGIAQAIQALPELLQLLDDYNVPVLDQVSTVLNCLDLFNKIKDLLDNFRPSDSPNARTVRTVQELPRLIQAVNTVNEVINNPNVDEDAVLPPEVNRSVINVELNLSRCFKLPQWTVDEATVNVREIQNQFIFFEASQLLLIQNDLTKRVSLNDLLYVKVDYFIHPLYGKLVPYITETQFTPNIYKYSVYEYSLEQNVGIASLIKEVYYIKLQNEEGFIYKFPIQAIGTDLTMVIKEAYLNR